MRNTITVSMKGLFMSIINGSLNIILIVYFLKIGSVLYFFLRNSYKVHLFFFIDETGQALTILFLYY